MFTSDVVEPVEGSKKHLLVSLFLLGGLLFLRFPFLIAGTLLLPQGPGVQGAMFFSFTIGTYLITAVLIWWERERLRDFRIDLPAAITFLLQLYCFPIGIGLFAAMRRKRARFPGPPDNVWRWALIGAILAVACNILAWKLGIEPASSRTAQPASFRFLLPALLTQMTFAAVWEEPLFRGFLWGYLRLARWKDGWIWLFQALLFTLGHVYYLQNEAIGPWFLRLMLPSLLIGFIAWRAKSIFASMVTHGMINASNDMLFHTRSLSEALRFSGSVIVILLVILALLWFGKWILQKGIKPDANTR